MGLLTPGHWQSTHWPSNHWADDHWQDVMVFSTPTCRIINIISENRTAIILSEVRTANIPIENRTVTVTCQ